MDKIGGTLTGLYFGGFVAIGMYALAAQPNPIPPLQAVKVYDARNGLTAIVFSRGDGTPAITLVTKMAAQVASLEFAVPIVGFDEAPPWQCGLLMGDANRDGAVDFADTAAVLANWGAKCTLETWK